jgi:hypothetical protein
LSQIIGTLRTPTGFTGHLHSRQGQGNQDRDDPDHHEQFHQRKRASSP